jgi:hypothetical protein
MNDFIYDDQRRCVAWILNGEVFTGGADTKRKVATIDHNGDILSLQGEFVGRLQDVGLVRKDEGDKTPEAFTKLL